MPALDTSADVFDPALCQFLRCLGCGQEATLELRPQNIGDGHEEGLACSSCRRQYPIISGIPVFFDQGPISLLDHPGGGNYEHDVEQKLRQQDWHDTRYIDIDYKGIKYRDRSLFADFSYFQLRDLEPLLRARTYPIVVNFCCGHGFEMEFLSQFTSRVVALDISLASLQKARSRGRLFGLEVLPICCDAEDVPLKSMAFDLALAHHGLHHLPNPMTGVREMIRVSRGQVAFCEPAKGLVRRVLVALGLKPSVEGSGNAIYEFSLAELRGVCDSNVRLSHFRRHLIPGLEFEPRIFKLIDRLRARSLVLAAVRIADKTLGRTLGTKCDVILERGNSGRIKSRPDDVC